MSLTWQLSSSTIHLSGFPQVRIAVDVLCMGIICLGWHKTPSRTRGSCGTFHSMPCPLFFLQHECLSSEGGPNRAIIEIVCYLQFCAGQASNQKTFFRSNDMLCSSEEPGKGLTPPVRGVLVETATTGIIRCAKILSLGVFKITHLRHCVL